MFSLLLLCGPALAQEDAELPPPPKRPGVRITFLPPPLKGTLSLGIFSKAGKLVRTLHREAAVKDFVVGLNGLITWWDGKDEAGVVAPIGKYVARGFAVGAVEFEGVAFHFNEWITDEKSPRLRRITDLRGEPGGLRLIGEEAGGRCVSFVIDADGRAHDFEPFGKVAHFAHGTDAAAEQFTGTPVSGLDGGGAMLLASADDRLLLREKGEWRWLDLPALEKPAHGCLGRDETLWIIDRAETGTEVKQYSFTGEFRRRLPIAREDPAPTRLAAMPADDTIALIEEAAGVQRVRLLTLAGSEPAPVEGEGSSTWKVTFSKTIRASDRLADVQGGLKTEAGEPFNAVEKINVRLLPNPLVRNASANVEITVGVDAKGSFLRTADGLPLKRITDTPGLKWAAMTRETPGKGVTIFQSDGAVVEEFNARKLASMMAFDAGDYDWTGK